MGIETRVKPISYLKAHSAEVIRDLGEGAGPLVITQNGEAKAVLQDVASYAATQELLALLKLLAMARDDMAAGRVQPLEGLKESAFAAARCVDGRRDFAALLEQRLLQRPPCS